MWSAFNTVRCVHISERTDREKYVDDLRLLGAPIKYYLATRQKDGRKGCYESHQEIMRQSLHFDNALIFEDDAVPVDLTHMLEVQSFMMKNKDWDVIYLGCFPDVFRKQVRVSGNIYLVKASMTHAYVVSQKYMKKFVDRPFDGIPIDNVFRNEAQTYAILPSMFKQAETESDVHNVLSDSRLKELGVYLSEWYCADIGVPLTHVCLLIFVLWIIVNGCSIR